MAIIGLQRRIREVGRIRMGVQATSAKTGNTFPRKLKNFRLSSSDRRVIDAVANVYGGKPQAWDNRGQDQWEVYTETDQLRIALPPDPEDMAWSQWYEQWTGGGCTHRCDGEREDIQDRPCVCDPDNRECKTTSRLSVLLPDIAGLGVWRLETHGYNAAVELAGAIWLITQMAGVHSIIPARLRLEERVQRLLVDGEPETRKFLVPVIDLDVSITDVRSIAVSHNRIADDDVPELEAPPMGSMSVGWKTVPPVEAPSTISVEAQVMQIETPKKRAPRKNAAAPLPATGRTPRTAAQAAADAAGCDICGNPYGGDPLVKNPVAGGSKFVHRKCLTVTPASQGQDEGSDGPPGGDVALPAEPVRPPVTNTFHGMTMGQHRKVFALGGELWDNEADAKAGVLELCRSLGFPGLTSRTQISRDMAMPLIDALQTLIADKMEATDE